MKRNSALRAGFTLIELMAVVLILAILAGVALPRFFDYQDRAREAACKGALGGVRSGIANWYANEAIENSLAKYPLIADLTKIGEVMQEAIPDNPYAGSFTNPAGVLTTIKGDAASRTISGTVEGWRYFDGGASDPAVFYANSDTGTIGENDF